jgi:hypothetical protein
VSALVAAAYLVGLTAAQDAPTNEVRKQGDVYVHDGSKSRFTAPKGWEVTRTYVVGNTAFLTLRRPMEGVEAEISWSPLLGKMEEAVEIEVDQLGKIYGKDKVTRRDAITVQNKPVFVIAVDDGPSFNGKETGVVYLFEAGPDEKSRWKVKLRATVQKKNPDGLKQVGDLMQNFQW